MISNDFKIETTRLVLRPFNKDDNEAIFSIQSNPEMTRFTPDETWKSLDDAYEFIKLAQRLYQNNHIENGFRFFFAVIEKSSNRLIGLCGLGGAHFNRRVTEVFYHIDYKFWGNGYATEAAKALLKYGFEDLKINRIIGFAEEENIASLKVLEKAGMKRNGVISGLPQEFDYFNGECLFELTIEEWEKN